MKGDEDLMKTWAVVIETENKLHRLWFDDPDNFGKFKTKFREFVVNNYQPVEPTHVFSDKYTDTNKGTGN